MVFASSSEPTSEFNTRCLDTLHAWERGEMPFKEALELFNAYKQEAINSHNIANQGRAEHMLGYIQHYSGNLNTSIQHYEQARLHYKRAGNRRRMAAIDLNLGENYRFKGDFNRALRLYRSVYDVSGELGDIRLQTMSAVNEGLILLTVEQNNAAKNAFQATLELAEQWEDDFDKLNEILCEVHHGMAVIYLREKNPSAAWNAALAAYETAIKTKQPLHMGFANRTVGEVISALDGSPDTHFSSDPEVYFRAALEHFREINAEAEVARTLFAQALSLAKKGRRTTAGRMLQQVIIIFSKLEMVDDAARAAQAQLAVL